MVFFIGTGFRLDKNTKTVQVFVIIPVEISLAGKERVNVLRSFTSTDQAGSQTAVTGPGAVHLAIYYLTVRIIRWYRVRAGSPESVASATI